jgi:hypothetical protein
LPIEKVKKLLKGCKNGDCAHSREYLMGEIDEYLTILKEKETQMRDLKGKLIRLKKTYGKNQNTKYCCNILGQLTEMNGGGDS